MCSGAAVQCCSGALQHLRFLLVIYNKTNMQARAEGKDRGCAVDKRDSRDSLPCQPRDPELPLAPLAPPLALLETVHMALHFGLTDLQGSWLRLDGAV